MEDLREVYEGCYRRLVSQLFAVCGSLAEAEDAVQEAFVRAIEKPSRFAQVDNPEAWLRMVALNIARSRFRRAATFHRLISRAGPPPDTVPGVSPDHVALVTALRRLPWDQREVITLHHIVDLPTREIAAQLNIPEGTVKARLARGRARLAPFVREFTEEVDHV
ncbi:sigma-70 family RNA polymerase sigma factor [Kribbella sandramycini]|uniref:RNA polymerase sigma-70 factor (ECF subfamily) n=1 Tax=Kribbella sandramycini TaxID=60450 RepID=A0A7Y4P1U1_9ACTN|nr:sigma-70 family RNA polymerase sigma factor [Kribbella sandramycini]MBB6566905.1 RNA polymerase sigma-70 factor (ECF subfamily) [Kribbella sandramycini]NOL44627.1 sigma-70 family RNA polymerase sigma factor [Kribbella sandramycini]